MSEITVFMGSVRKNGNTDLLVKSFAEGAGKNNKVNTINVSDYNICPCVGCNSCFDREGNRCFQNDDMNKIYELLKHTDILVIASPVYFYGVSAQLKAIIDRLHTPMRNTFTIKKLGLLLVGASELPNLFEPIKMQYQMVLDYFHLESIGMTLVRGVRDKGDICKTEALQEAYELGLFLE